MKPTISEISLGKAYPYNSITERFEGKTEEKRAWVNDFYRAIGYSLFLARQENDTSLRQSYILLDNVVEQFLKSYLQNVVKGKFVRDKINFNELISIAIDNIENSNEILERILECHKTRNNLYHSSVYLSISKSRFLDYLDDIFSLCKVMGFENISDIIYEDFNKIMKKIFDERTEMRFQSLKQVGDKLKDNFGITPGNYHGDIFLGSVPGDSSGAIDSIKTLLGGIFRREEVDGKKVRVLEIIEANEENAFHSFFISHTGSITWYCFYNCFWSKWGNGEKRDIQQIRELIKQNEDTIDYKVDYIRKGFFQNAFDSYFTGES